MHLLSDTFANLKDVQERSGKIFPLGDNLADQLELVVDSQSLKLY